MKNFILFDGNKDDYIYYLLKFNNKQIYPLYKNNSDFLFAYCRNCSKSQKTFLCDGYEANDYFYCKFCNEFNEKNSPYNFRTKSKKVNNFSNKYIFLNKNIKVKKKNKIKIEKELNKFTEEYYTISNKKYKFKIDWTCKIFFVNFEIKKYLPVIEIIEF